MKDENRLIPTTEEAQLATAKQYFYQYFGQPEKVSKVFEGVYLYKKEEINELNNSIAEKFKMYPNAGFLITVTAKLKNRKMIEFNTWDSFMAYEWAEDSETESLTIKWQANIILPNNDTPHNHVLSVTLTNGMKPEELIKLIFSGSLEDDKNLDIAPFPIFASVVFINRLLADELLDVVTKWANRTNLEDIEDKKIKKICHKHRQLIAISTEFLITFLLMSSSILSFMHALGSSKTKLLGQMPMNEVSYFLTYSFIVLGVIVMANRLAKIIAQTVFKSLSKLRVKSYFEFGSKDKNRVLLLKNKEKNSMLRLVVGLGMIILSSFVGKLIDILINLIF